MEEDTFALGYAEKAFPDLLKASASAIVLTKISLNAQTLLVFAAVFLALLLAFSKRKTSLASEGLPPGPWPWPVVGNIFSLGVNPHLTFMEMAKKYGDVFTIYLGRRPVVVINGFEATKQALLHKRTQFAGRPTLALTDALTGGGKGIVCSDYSEAWKEQRKFTLQTLRDFGMGKSSQELNILEEVKSLIEAIDNQGGKAFSIEQMLDVSVSNVICAVLFGSRYQYKNSDFQKILQIIKRFCEIGTSANALNFFPILMYLPFGVGKEIFSLEEKMGKFMRQKLEEHKKKFDPDNLQDFIDVYLNELRQREDRAEESFFSEKYLFYILKDLFFAGTETMAATLRWAILYMTAFEDVQEKVQTELDRVVGDRLPTLSDRPKLIYTEATLMETQRMANITALTFPHKTLEQTELLGYTLPEGTTTFINLYSVHVDEREWIEPNRFDPTRFLSPEGKLVNRQALMPFSAGRRGCPGEKLAKSELFLFFSCLLHQFKFKSPADSKPNIEKHFGISLVPAPFEVCAISR